MRSLHASALARWGGATPPRTAWPGRRLALAFGASLVLHVLLLSFLRPGGSGGSPLPRVLYVTLASAPSAVPPAAAAPPPAAPLAAAPAPVPQPAPATAPRTQAAEARAPDKPAPAPSPAASAAAQPPRSGTPFVGEAQLDRPARPLSWPSLDAALRKELTGRRLRMQVWVQPDGGVERLAFNNAELSPPTLRALEEAVLRVRFAPGARDGRDVGSIFSTRLCFDEQGQFAQDSDECWRAPER